MGLLVGILAMTGCGEEETPRPKPEPSDTEILPQAVLAETRAALTGAVDSTAFAADTEGVFAVTAMLSKDSSKESDIYFLNQPVNTLADGSLRFDTNNANRFYPYDPNQKLWFYAYSPAKGIQDPSYPMKVRFELTGQEDVMIGRCVNNSGIGKVYADANGVAFKQKHPEFKFEHLLTRFNFKLQRGVGYGDRLRVNGMQIFDVEKNLELNLLTGKIEPDSTSKTTMTIDKDMVNTSIGNGNAVSYSTIMCGERDKISFNVTSMGILYPTMTVTANSIKADQSKFEAGKSYDIILTFTGVEITVKASLANWKDGGSSEEKIVID